MAEDGVTAEAGFGTIRCDPETVGALLSGIREALDLAGTEPVVVSVGAMPPAPGTPSHEWSAHFAVAPGLAVAMRATPADQGDEPDGPPDTELDISLTGEGVRRLARAALTERGAAIPHDRREWLESVAADEALPDSTAPVAAAILAQVAHAMEHVSTALRDRDRATHDVHTRFAESERHRAAVNLARAMAHHYNNRLAVIMARAELAAIRTPSPVTDSSARAVAAACRSCCDYLVRMFSYTSRRPLDSPGSSAVDEVVRNALGSLTDLVAAVNSTLREPVVLREDLDCGLWVRLPREDLHAAVEVLVVNAVEASPYGGEIAVRTRTHDGWALVEVEDSGLGMASSVASKVFNPFYTTKGPNHVGISLSHVQSAIVQHGGELEVHTREGEGSVFRLRVPGASMPRDTDAQPKRVGGHPVLVVEDEDDVRTALCDLLDALGFDVVPASGGRAAEHLAATRAVGAVLTDLGVPDFTAFELAKRIRASGLEAPILVLTGWVHEVDPAAAAEAGIDRVLLKPISAEDLRAALAEFGVSPRPAPAARKAT